jgi:four helix bundle protein
MVENPRLAYLNHLSIATGSLVELGTQIQISARLYYLDSETLNDVLARTDEIGKMLSGLRGSLNPQSSILNPE